MHLALRTCSWDEALTYGSWIAGVMAQSKVCGAWLGGRGRAGDAPQQPAGVPAAGASFAHTLLANDAMQPQGRSLGLYEAHEKTEEEREERRQRDEELGVQRVPVFGMQVSAAPVRPHEAGRWLAGSLQWWKLLAAATPSLQPACARPPPGLKLQVGDELHAVKAGQPIKPSSVESYLQRAFGEDGLPAAKVGGA